MTDWNPKANDLFLRAREFPDPEARRAFLDDACGTDQGLRQQVESLLAAGERAGNFLERPAILDEPLDQTTDAPVLIEAGRVIGGRYKLLEKIGIGGMGAVWMAEQIEPVQRRVAVKLIKPGMDSARVICRFEAERQALALMDHPNIAKVLDGGATPDGRPFFVMELVKGTPITAYCDDKKLPIDDRLTLFADVCKAVQHAHQKAIVHRDLKPSNVLVAPYDGKPVVKVIDFGVAKALGQKLTEATWIGAVLGAPEYVSPVASVFTEAIVGTPEYMSPEQAELNNQDVDTRSDIYSLGVLLYELLTGSTPLTRQRVQEAALMEALRLVREEEPPRPSKRLSSTDALPSIAAVRGVEPAKLSRQVRGDLDWVVMKALEKDRNRRFETANGFALDIGRYLNLEPVLARPPSAGYRLRKFVQRNRRPMIAVGLVLGTLLAGIVGTTLGLVRAENQRLVAEEKERDARLAADEERLAKLREAEHRAKAEKARDRTSSVLDAMTSAAAGDSLSTQQMITPEQRKFLTEVLTYYREFASDNADDEQSRVRTVNAANRVGVIEHRLGRTEREVAAFRMALDGYRALTADYPTVPGYRQKLAGGHDNLGISLTVLGKNWEARMQYQLALAIQENLTTDFPSVPSYRKHLADFHHHFGVLLKALGKQADARDHYSKALDIHEKLVSQFPTEADIRRGLADIHGSLGVMLNDRLGEPETARVHLLQALAIDEKLAIEFPDVHSYQRDLAYSFHNLGSVLIGLGKHAEGQEHYRKALDIREKLATDFPSEPFYRWDWASSHGNLGRLQEHQGNRAKAQEHYRKALDIEEKLIADFPDVPNIQHELAGNMFAYGILLSGLGNRSAAQDLYHKGLAILEKLAARFPEVPDYRLRLAGGLIESGKFQSTLGNRDKAREHYSQSLDILIQLSTNFPDVPDYQRELAVGRLYFGRLLFDLGNRDKALEQFHEALAIQMKLSTDFPDVPTYRGNLAHCFQDLGEVQRRLGNRVASKEQHIQALIIREKLVAEFPAVPDYRRELANSHHSLGIILASLEDRVSAQEQYRKAITILEDLAAGNPDVASYQIKLGRIYWNLGIVIRERGESTESLVWFDKSIAMLESVHRSDASDVSIGQYLRNSYSSRAMSYDELMRYTESEKDWGMAIDLSPPYEQLEYRRRLVMSRHKAGQVVEAVAGAAELTRTSTWNAGQWYDFARIYAVASNKVAEKKQEYSDRAIVLLQKAVQAGFNNAAQVKKDTDLNPLRDRKDFKTLMADLEAKISLQVDATGCIANGNWSEALRVWPKSMPITDINLELEFNHAALLVLTGDKEGYQRLCAEVLKRSGTANEPREYYLSARICSLAPEAVTDTTQPIRHAERAVSAEPLGAWNTHTLGLAHYRAGPLDKARLEKAIESIRRSMAMDGKLKWSANICNQLVLAMLEHRQQHHDEAKELLDQACQWIDNAKPRMQFTHLNETWSPGKLHPHDWLAMHILRREAEELIRPARGKPLEQAPSPHPKKQ
jgi:serine/threonine protein kinase